MTSHVGKPGISFSRVLIYAVLMLALDSRWKAFQRGQHD